MKDRHRRRMKRLSNMAAILDRILQRYENTDFLVRMKARFFFFLCLVLLLFIPIIMSYSAYAHLHNPAFNYQLNFAILIPQAIAFILFIATLTLLLRGYFVASANTILILSFITLWAVMCFDRSTPVSRLDTIALVISLLMLTPMAVLRRGYVIIGYGAANLSALLAYMLYFRDQLAIPHDAFIDYIADNSIAITFVSIIAFCIFVINRKALDRANTEITERVRAEEALRESEERYRMLFESSRDAIVIMEAPSWTYLAVNKAAFEMFRINPSTLKVPITGPWDLAPEFQPNGENSRDMAMNMFQKSLTEGWCFFEYRHRRLNGEEFPATVLLSKCELHNRTLIQATMHDITERKRAEEQIKASLNEKEILLKEIHHRVKNNMQIIISLLSLQTGSIKDKALLKIFTDSTNRIRAMALVHEKLYQSNDMGKIDFTSYITTISEDLLSNYSIDHSKPRMHIEAGTIYLGIDQAIPCGLIVNELITNALKYAFPAGRNNNEILISLRQDNTETITLTIRDNGVGLPEGLDHKEISTLGLQLVHVLVEQIGGEYRIDRQLGTAWIITIPSDKTPAPD